jgi:hypothetical protein
LLVECSTKVSVQEPATDGQLHSVP